MFEHIEYTYIIDTQGKTIYSSSAKNGNKSKHKKLSDFLIDVSENEFKDYIKRVKNGENVNFTILVDELSDNYKQLFCLIIPLYDSNGEINNASVIIADRKYELLFKENNDALFITDLDGNYLVNSIASGRSGIPDNEFKELSLFNIPSKKDSNRIKKYIKKIVEKGNAVQQIEYLNSKGKQIFTEVSGKKITFDGKTAILHSSREVSEQRKSNQRNLASIIQSEDNDRKYYSSEILDNLSPLLSINKMLIETYFDLEKPEVKNQVIKKVKANLEEAIKIAAELTQDISPQLLTKFGIRPALEHFITKFVDEQNIEIGLILDIPEKISKKIDPILYRAIVEIINYFTKYKLVRHINIEIISINNKLRCILESDNDSIKSKLKPDLNHRLKRFNLESRLHSIDGEFIYTKIENIYKVTIEIPF